MFSQEYGMRNDKKKVLVLISDGKEMFAMPGQISTDDALKTIKDKGTISFLYLPYKYYRLLAESTITCKWF